jgi:hypothetical protein
MASEPKYRIILQAHGSPTRAYSYVIVRTDRLNWTEVSPVLYPTPEAASEAGWAALERYAQDATIDALRSGPVPT